MQCPTCHQNILPEYYFCPNCGTRLHEPPLSTSAASQAKLYLHSILLPCIAFLSISKWQGLRYARSEDQKTKQIGVIAFLFLILSTTGVVWYTISFTQSLTKSLEESISSNIE